MGMFGSAYGRCVGIKLKTDKKFRPVSGNVVAEMKYRESLNNGLHNWLILTLRTGHVLELSPELVDAIKRTKPGDGEWASGAEAKEARLLSPASENEKKTYLPDGRPRYTCGHAGADSDQTVVKLEANGSLPEWFLKMGGVSVLLCDDCGNRIVESPAEMGGEILLGEKAITFRTKGRP